MIVKLLNWLLRRPEEDNPPPGGYFKSGEWNDPEPRRNFNVNPFGTRYASGDDRSDAEWDEVAHD